MSFMEINETRERFDESMRRAISRARELAILLKRPVMNNWAISLEEMRQNGMKLANATSMTVLEVNKSLDGYRDNMLRKQESLH